MRNLILLTLFWLMSCSSFDSKESFLTHYESVCRTDLSRSGVRFSVLPLSPDYEKAKWGTSPDSAFRLLFWGERRLQVSVGEAFLIASNDTLPSLSYRKSPVFETGSTDAYVFGFSEPSSRKREFVLRGFGNFGTFMFKLKDCSHLRFKEKESK